MSDADLARTGGLLRRIRTSRVDLDWIQGPGPTDVWIWQSDGREHIEMSFVGRSVLLRSGHLSTGVLREGGGTPYAEDAGLIELELHHNLATLRAAFGILNAAPEEVKSPAILAFLGALQAAIAALGGPPMPPREPNI